jgi:hypothetical protein
VKIANNVTRPLQCLVQYQQALTTFTAAKGARTSLSSPVPLHALVDYKAVQVRTREGVNTVTRSIVTLLDIKEIVAATGGQGIGNNDKITFPDGDTGPILDISGFLDAGTGHPIATTIMIG